MNITKETKELFDDLVKYFLKTISLVTNCKSLGIRIEHNNEDYPFYYYMGYSNDFIKTENSLTSGNNYDLECLCGQIILDRQKENPAIFTKNGSFFIDSFSEEREKKYELCKRCIKNLRTKCFEFFKNLALIPIRLEGKCIGLFHIADIEVNLDSNRITQLEEISHIFSNMMLELNRKAKNIEKQYNDLSKIATIDFLTGVYNRFSLERKIKEEENKVKHYGNKFKFKWSILYIDLDNFKYYNDNFGHAIGDKIIKKFAEILKNSCRISDFIARFGGDEFIIILPQTDANEARFLAERILKKIELNGFFKNVVLESTGVNVNIPDTFLLSCSIGIAEYRDGLTFNNLIKMADSAMYIAKNRGKNKYFIWQHDLQENLNIPHHQENGAFSNNRHSFS
ncbi:MAG TPA: GGDEF domain-containing protein [Spirochaetota bacterium]|nr:GGDEF domain-containing protein [Spirochaetota bacterium]HOL58205.1 GGDEF domain-containing protein [Spirochaetota bacterium]